MRRLILVSIEDTYRVSIEDTYRVWIEDTCRLFTGTGEIPPRFAWTNLPPSKSRSITVLSRFFIGESTYRTHNEFIGDMPQVYGTQLVNEICWPCSSFFRGLGDEHDDQLELSHLKRKDVEDATRDDRDK